MSPPVRSDLGEDDATKTVAPVVPASGSGPRGREDVTSWLDPLVGAVIAERFAVLDVLGAGGMGGVLRVRDTRPLTERAAGGRFRSANDEYALKLLRRDPEPVESGSGVTAAGWRFIREYRMGLRRLSGSGRAVRSYELGTADLMQ